MSVETPVAGKPVAELKTRRDYREWLRACGFSKRRAEKLSLAWQAEDEDSAAAELLADLKRRSEVMKSLAK